MLSAPAAQPKERGLPYELGTMIFFVQVATGLVLFATFQEYVPNQLGTGNAWPGLLFGAYGAARFVSETPTGAITDRIERRRSLLAGFLVMTPAILLMAVIREPVAYLVFSLMLGLGAAFIWPATYAISADLYAMSSRGKVIGFLNLCQLLGFGVGALAGALVVESYPNLQFVIAAGSLGVAFAIVVWLIPAYRQAGEGPPLHTEHRPSLRSIMSKRIAGLSVLILAATSSAAMLVPAIRPYGQETLELSFAELTIALIPAIVIGALSYIPAGHLADHFGRTTPFLAGQFLVCVALLAISVVDVVPLAAALAILVFCGYTMSVPAWNAAVMDLAPESHRGTLIGLSVALSGLGLAVGPAIGGIIAEAASAEVTFRTAAVVSFATGIAIYGYWRIYGRKQEATAEHTLQPPDPRT